MRRFQVHWNFQVFIKRKGGGGQIALVFESPDSVSASIKYSTKPQEFYKNL